MLFRIAYQTGTATGLNFLLVRSSYIILACIMLLVIIYIYFVRRTPYVVVYSCYIVTKVGVGFVVAVVVKLCWFVNNREIQILPFYGCDIGICEGGSCKGKKPA
jgi:hypothetical protein